MAPGPTHVILGAGHAGGRAAEAMRAIGFDGTIVLIGEEQHLPYERPPLSKELLQGQEDAHAQIRDDAFYGESDIDCRLGVRATALRPADRVVALESGETVAYDKLLLTTGGTLRRLEIPGQDRGNVFYLRTLDDSRAIDRCIKKGGNVVVVGGGFIGLEVAASARLGGCAVTVLEVADRLMERAVTPEISDSFLDLHRANGVDILLGAEAVRFDGGESVERVELRDGTTLPADLVVIGIGIAPNTELAEAAGLRVDDGIVVDQFCRTSVPDIYAAGDVTRHYNSIHDLHIRLESWQNAQNQAIAAARVMCGDEAPFAEVPWMWSDQFDANLQIAGAPESWQRVIYRGEPTSRDMIAFQIANGVLVGALAVNRPRDMRFARRLIGAQKPLDLDALADETVALRDLAR